MSVVTGRRLQRVWQKGIKPLKDLLGSHDIADLSEDGTVTGALSKLNTDMEDTENGIETANARIDDLMYQRTYGYNNSGSTHNFYVHFNFRSGDKGTILMMLIGSNADYGCVKRYLPIGSDIGTSPSTAKGATLQTSGKGSGYNGENIQSK